ncbi:MAG: hypothetical protein JWN51_3491 [Phycisphaerales bacterium]|nr:hypothetical protein [Phycisphaerales bacterium]
MKLRNLRRRHWLAIGLLTGLLLGGVRVAIGPAYLDSPARTLSQPLFERGLTAPPGAAFHLGDMVVHPPDPNGVYWITGTYRETSGRDEVSTGEFKFRAATPYQPRMAVDVPDPQTFTIIQYLDQLAPRIPQARISYRNAWYERPRLAMTAWTAGATFLIGVLWPLMLRRWAGPVPIPEPAAMVVATPSSPAPTAPAANPAAGDELLDLVLNLETSVQPAIESFGTENIAAGPPAPVRTLSAAPLEGSVAASRQEDERDYRGEYYPTLVHAKPPPAASRPS